MWDDASDELAGLLDSAWDNVEYDIEYEEESDE